MAEIKGSPVRAKYSYNFMGSQTIYDELLKEQRRDDLFQTFGNDETMSFFKQTGREKGVSGMKFTHREDVRSNERIVATGSGGSANGAVTQTVTTPYTYTFDSVLPYTASNETVTSIPRPQTLLLYPNGVQGMVDTIDKAANTFVVYPITDGESIPAVDADDIIVNLGVMAEEGSGFPDPIAYRSSEFQGGLAIAKDTQEITDMARGASTTIQMPDGTWVWTVWGWKKVLRKVKNELEARMFVGKKITNATLLNKYPEMASASGYLPYIDDSGYVIDYDSVGGLSLSDIDKFVAKADNIGAPTEFNAFGATNFNLGADDLLKDLGGQASYVTFSGGQEMAVKLGFKSVTRSVYTLHLKRMHAFNHPELLGADGHKYKGTSVLCPSKGSGVNHRGEKVPYLQVRNFESEDGNYNGGWEEKVRGGIDGMNELEESVIKYYVTIRKGFEAFGQQHHMKMQELT